MLKKEILIILLLIFLSSIHHIPIMIISNFSGLGDPTNQDLPLRYLAAKIWDKGKIPLRNPYNFYGDSIAGKTHSAVFYPLNFIYIFFHPLIAKKILIFFHYSLLSIGMYFFIRSFSVSRSISLFSSLFLSTNPIGYQYIIPCLDAYSWLPWLCLLYHKIIISNYKLVYIILFSTIFSLSFLAGYTQIWLYITIISSLYFITHLIIEKKLSLRIIKLIPIIITIFLIFCIVQILISYSEFKFSRRAEINICEQFEKNQLTTWNLKNLIHNNLLAEPIYDNIFYILSGFFFPLYSVGIIVLFIYQNFNKRFLISYFIIFAILISLIFIGDIPCHFLILRNFQHHIQFFPTLIPFIVSLIIAFVLYKETDKNNKLLIISLLLIIIIFILIPNKKINLHLWAELIFNLVLCLIIFLYLSKRNRVLLILFFIFAIGYNGVKNFYIDRSLYNYDWYKNAEVSNKKLLENKIIDRNSIIYADAFVSYSPYKRFLNCLFGIKNFQLNTFDALIASDVWEFFNRLSNNKIDIRNFKFFGVKYIFFNKEPVARKIDKFYINQSDLLRKLKAKKIISACFLKDGKSYISYIDKIGGYHIWQTEEGKTSMRYTQKPLVISCPLKKEDKPQYLIYPKKNNLIISNYKSNKEIGKIKLTFKIFDFNVKAIFNNDELIIFFIDIRGRINIIKIRDDEGNFRIIKKETKEDGYFMILSLNNFIDDRGSVFILDRRGKIFSYDIETNELNYLKDLPGYIFSSFALMHLAHLELLKDELKGFSQWREIPLINENYEIWEYTGKVFPEVWMVSETKFINDDDFYKLLEREFTDFNKIAFVNDKKYLYKFKGDGSYEISILENNESTIKLSINASSNGILIIRNRWAPCWYAKMDGEERMIFKTNVFMQGIVIEKGIHNIELNCNLRNLIKFLTER